MRLDEILAALPEVGLELWMLDQIGPRWHASVHDPKSPADTRHEAEGDSPLAAMVAAVRLAGVDVSDE